MIKLDQVATNYLKIRRARGFKLTGVERTLRQFASFAEQLGCAFITTTMVSTWLNGIETTPAGRARRFNELRQFGSSKKS